jgi:hypothetical protein
MIPRRPGALLAAALAMAAASAAPAQSSGPFRVELDRLVLLPGGTVGEERTLAMGETILTTRIGYAAAAIPSAPIAATMADLPVELAAGEQLLAATAQGATRAMLGNGAQVFCGVPIKAAVPAPPPGERGRRRFDDLVRPCFVDADGDRRLEGAFLVGTRRPEDRVLVPIPPTPYETVANVPLANSSFTFFVGAGPILYFEAQLEGHRPTINGVYLMTNGREQALQIGRSVRSLGYPATVSYGPAQFTLTGWDAEGQRLRVRVDRAFDNTPVRFRYFNNAAPMTIPVYISR